MDFAQLALVRQQRQQLDQQRNNLAEKHCQQGFEALTAAFLPEFATRRQELLLNAINAFEKALQQSRSLALTYIGLAYLWTSVRQNIKALAYLKEAERLDPRLPGIEDLRTGILNAQKSLSYKPTQASSQTSALSPADALQEESVRVENSLDDLYDTVESRLDELLLKVSTDAMNPLKAELDPSALRSLTRQMQSWQSQHHAILADLEILDAEIDIVPLKLKTRPIESLIQRYKQLLQFSAQLKQIMERISHENEMVMAQIQETRHTNDPEDIPILEKNLGILMDHCDQIADELDALEEKGLDINPAMSLYASLCQNIEALNDSVEDLANR
jgi:hypothetical protein